MLISRDETKPQGNAVAPASRLEATIRGPTTPRRDAHDEEIRDRRGRPERRRRPERCCCRADSLSLPHVRDRRHPREAAPRPALRGRSPTSHRSIRDLLGAELLDVEFDLPPDFWEDYEECQEWLDACAEVCAPSSLSHTPTALLRGRLLWAV